MAAVDAEYKAFKRMAAKRGADLDIDDESDGGLVVEDLDDEEGFQEKKIKVTIQNDTSGIDLDENDTAGGLDLLTVNLAEGTRVSVQPQSVFVKNHDLDGMRSTVIEDDHVDLLASQKLRDT